MTGSYVCVCVCVFPNMRECMCNSSFWVWCISSNIMIPYPSIFLQYHGFMLYGIKFHCVYKPHFPYQSSVGGSLCWLCVLSAMNKAVINMGEEVFLCYTDSQSFSDMLKSGIVGFYGSSSQFFDELLHSFP